MRTRFSWSPLNNPKQGEAVDAVSDGQKLGHFCLKTGHLPLEKVVLWDDWVEIHHRFLIKIAKLIEVSRGTVDRALEATIFRRTKAP